MKNSLEGKIAVVTGASSGIGAAIARALAAEGVRTIVTARREDRLRALAAELREAEIHTHASDLANEDGVLSLFAAADRVGPVDILVNCAGTATATPTEALTLDEWNKVITLNLTATFLCAREAMRRMIPRGQGRIINIGSISGLVPRENSLAYTASKFGLEGMTRSLALDGRKHGVTVSILRPGATISELGGMAPERLQPGPGLMDAATVAATVVAIAALPRDANLLEATILPIDQPFLGRG